MGPADEILDQLREDIAPARPNLEAARERRDDVLAGARKHPGVTRTFKSGSVAHGLVVCEAKDGDGGAVLDQEAYGDLGPDGDNRSPLPIAEEMRTFLREETDLLDKYPDATLHVQDRAITMIPKQPLPDGQDPRVDLIVGLDRQGADGIWIPKGMRSSTPGWSPSHPEKHTDLFLPPDKALRATRARATRFSKVWNNRFSEPYFSSFNLAAFAYWHLDEPMSLSESLAMYFREAHATLSVSLTDDPAGVSGKIKLLTTKDAGLRRLRKARDLAEEAAAADTEDAAREPLNKLFPDFVAPPARTAEAHGLTNALRQGAGGRFRRGALVGGGPGLGLKPSDSYGTQ